MRAPLTDLTSGPDTSAPVRVRPVTRGTRVWLSVFAVLTVAATSALFVLAAYTDQWFAWTIEPPLSAAFLGAGYAAGCVLVVLALRTASWAHARVAVVTVLAFTVITLAATLLHLDRFHFSADGPVARSAAWFWLAVYVVVPVGLVVAVVRQRRNPASDPLRQLPLPRVLAATLIAQGAIMLVVGVVLFVAPGAAASIWPWTLTPLTAQMIAAWLIAFGLAMALALRERDLGRLEIPAIGYTVFGLMQLLALVRFPDQLSGEALVTIGYVVVLVSIPLTGAAGWWLARRGRRRLQPVGSRP
jgi:hypothetical protein